MQSPLLKHAKPSSQQDEISAVALHARAVVSCPEGLKHFELVAVDELKSTKKDKLSATILEAAGQEARKIIMKC